MAIIWQDDEPYADPGCRVLNFPPCCMGIGYVPERVSWREWARIEIASWRGRRARGAENDSNQGSGASNAANVPQINARSTENQFQDRDSCRTEPRTPVITVQTDTQGSPSGQINWRHLSAVRRELIEQNMTEDAVELAPYPEIVAVERKVRKELYG